MSEKTKLTAKENFMQMLKFVLFSCGAGIIQLASFTLLNELLHLSYWVSYLIALTLSVLYNFTVNRRFTFKSANNVPRAMSLVILFYVAFTPYSTWLTHLLADVKGLNEYLVVFICMVQNLILEFLWCRFVVYRNSINSNSLANKKNDIDIEKAQCKVDYEISENDDYGIAEMDEMDEDID